MTKLSKIGSNKCYGIKKLIFEFGSILTTRIIQNDWTLFRKTMSNVSKPAYAF